MLTFTVIILTLKVFGLQNLTSKYCEAQNRQHASDVILKRFGTLFLLSINSVRASEVISKRTNFRNFPAVRLRSDVLLLI